MTDTELLAKLRAKRYSRLCREAARRIEELLANEKGATEAPNRELPADVNRS
ncbi:hypothetical protein HNO53_20830 [Billgrantia antri]|uniref:Uncharacterized protein n=1 Tax=Halomonas sulfidivorans TaxID=2733488 RepID=A0ABX7WRX4_9GAMM|nr:hypothetical protein [Halomonas sulfidivorans]QTP60944.1 hypothetical protein HNO53_20830 [Halomonas sulfidivorans]